MTTITDTYVNNCVDPTSLVIPKIGCAAVSSAGRRRFAEVERVATQALAAASIEGHHHPSAPVELIDYSESDYRLLTQDESKARMAFLASLDGDSSC